MNPEYSGQDPYSQSTRHWVLGLPFSSAHVAVVTDERATEAVTQPPRAVKAELPSGLQAAGPAALQRSAGPAGAAAAPGGPGRRPAGRETRGASGGAGGRCRVAGHSATCRVAAATCRRVCKGSTGPGANEALCRWSGSQEAGNPSAGRGEAPWQLQAPQTGRLGESGAAGKRQVRQKAARRPVPYASAWEARVREEVGERRGGRPWAHVGRRALRDPGTRAARAASPPLRSSHLSHASP